MTPAFIYIFVIFVSKNREKRNKTKKNWPLCRVLKPKHSAKWPAQVSSAASLPSAKVLALGKDLKVCRVPGSSTRQSSHVAGPWRGHFAECQTRTLGKVWNFAECLPLGTRQSAGPGWRHVAALPSVKALGKAFAECPKSDTRQSQLCCENLCRVSFAECYTRQRLCWVGSVLCRV